MLVGAGLFPSTFSLDEVNEANAYSMLTAGMEVMRMIRDNDAETSNGLAASIYRDFFTNPA